MVRLEVKTVNNRHFSAFLLICIHPQFIEFVSLWRRSLCAARFLGESRSCVAFNHFKMSFTSYFHRSISPRFYNVKDGFALTLSSLERRCVTLIPLRSQPPISTNVFVNFKTNVVIQFIFRPCFALILRPFHSSSFTNFHAHPPTHPKRRRTRRHQNSNAFKHFKWM